MTPWAVQVRQKPFSRQQSANSSGYDLKCTFINEQHEDSNIFVLSEEVSVFGVFAHALVLHLPLLYLLLE